MLGSVVGFAATAVGTALLAQMMADNLASLSGLVFAIVLSIAGLRWLGMKSWPIAAASVGFLGMSISFEAALVLGYPGEALFLNTAAIHLVVTSILFALTFLVRSSEQP